MNPSQLNTGRKILSDWLGNGGQPVPYGQAANRAEVCKQCPHNYRGSWLYNMATQSAINSHYRLKQTMGIRLVGEEDLNICDLCGCQMRLKVHVPFEHIYAHTTLEQFAKLPNECWQKKELSEIQTPKQK